MWCHEDDMQKYNYFGFKIFSYKNIIMLTEQELF